MRMGNFMFLRVIVDFVMAATERRFGIHHLTVVPTNFEPPTESADNEENDGE